MVPLVGVVVVFYLSLVCRTSWGLRLLQALLLSCFFSPVRMAPPFCLFLEVALVLDLTSWKRLPPWFRLVLKHSCWLICGFLLLLVVGVVVLLVVGAPWLHPSRYQLSGGVLLLVLVSLVVLALLMGLDYLEVLHLLGVLVLLMALEVLAVLILLMVLVGLVVLMVLGECGSG